MAVRINTTSTAATASGIESPRGLRESGLPDTPNPPILATECSSPAPVPAGMTGPGTGARFYS